MSEQSSTSRDQEPAARHPVQVKITFLRVQRPNQRATLASAAAA